MKKIIVLLSVTLLACFFVATWAHAGGFDKVASQIEYPDKAIERPVGLTKGWWEFNLGYSFFYTEEFFDGAEESVDGMFELRESQFDLSMRFGWTRNLTVGLRVPYIMRTFKDKITDLRSEEESLGDGSIWATWQFLNREDPTTSLALRFRMHAPTGNESPGSMKRRMELLSGDPTDTADTDDQVYVEDPQSPDYVAPELRHLEGFLNPIIFSRGVFGASGSIVASQQIWDYFSIGAEVGYTWWIPATVQFEVTKAGMNARVDYGDEIFVKSRLVFQVPEEAIRYVGYIAFWPITLPLHILTGADPAANVAVGANVAFVYRGTTQAGNRDDMKDIEDHESFAVFWPEGMESAGWGLQAGGDLTLQINEHWEFTALAKFAIAGKGDQLLFPLSATGQTYCGVVTFRF